ncbi:hypothetical protein TNCV_5085421 [Trichonephila clavipes]|uniref:Uncharacterized protein n=1 Tax=Trichonephila clavipes TaxID=2585209 RepID=A0A8X6V751_TRICX|nr:hypothetical protein TNCV_5085421 [Trichonephila clavipes]
MAFHPFAAVHLLHAAGLKRRRRKRVRLLKYQCWLIMQLSWWLRELTGSFLALPKRSRVSLLPPATACVPTVLLTGLLYPKKGTERTTQNYLRQ